MSTSFFLYLFPVLNIRQDLSSASLPYKYSYPRPPIASVCYWVSWDDVNSCPVLLPPLMPTWAWAVDTCGTRRSSQEFLSGIYLDDFLQLFVLCLLFFCIQLVYANSLLQFPFATCRFKLEASMSLMLANFRLHPFVYTVA